MIASSITELNSYVRLLLEKDEVLQSVYVVGEISNFKCHSSGHIYFSLKDEKCSVKCMMFSQYTKGINFDIENGTQVFAYGSVSCYEPMGQYQLYVYHLSPAGIGQINNELKKLYKKLEAEGLFDPDKKKKLKKFPRKIGIVTSKTGAVIHDISSVLKRRFPIADIVVCSSKVQGLDAPEEIVKSIKVLEKYPDIDVIIIARGGGSTEDLWAFNNEKVIREIVKCKIPTISAVGHDVDYTLCDYAADVRASTPSVAAELASESIDYILKSMENTRSGINFLLSKKISNLDMKLEKLKSILSYKSFSSLFLCKESKLFDLKRKLNFNFSSFLQEKECFLKKIKNKIIIFNPENLFRRGYTMVHKGKDHVCCLDDISENCELTLKFFNGYAKFNVTNLKKEYLIEKENI